jgi:hypothetical protein
LNGNPVNGPYETGGGAFVYDPNSEALWRHLGDVVVDFATGPLHLLLNADYGTQRINIDPANGTKEWVAWYGVDLTARYALTDQLSVAVRGGYFGDQQGYTVSQAFGLPLPNQNVDLWSGTLTLGYQPVSQLNIKLEGRHDWSTQDVFVGHDGGSKDQTTITLGVVATTN